MDADYTPYANRAEDDTVDDEEDGPLSAEESDVDVDLLTEADD
jgi:hypothetical protein